MRNIRLTLSTSETNNVGQIVIRQDDTNSQKIIADITENGSPKSLAGYTVFFNAMIDDNVIARDLATVMNDYQVTYVLKDAFSQKLGRVHGFFSFEKDGTRESTADFYYHVIAGACRNIHQGNYIYEFEQLKSLIGNIINSDSLIPLIKQITDVDSKSNSNFSSVKAEIKKHEEDTNNPHKVTLSQLGTYSKSDIDKRIVKSKKIYDGGSDNGLYFGANNDYPYNLSSNQKLVKVATLWSRHNQNGDGVVNNFGYYIHEVTAENLRNGSYYIPLFYTAGDTHAVKQVYYKANSIAGNERNYDDDQCKYWKLREIRVYYYEV